MSEKLEKIGGVTIDYEFFDDAHGYSEGDEAEEYILEAIKNGRDIFDVLRNDDRFPILYQLSPRRKFIASPMDIGKNDEVLEIGAGMGAVTEGLAEKAGHVDCIDLSIRRSQANAYRNKDRNNIRIYVGNFERIELKKTYDVVVLVGVLEYAQLYINSKDPFVDFLKYVRALLKPDGRAYVAIENRLGMRYFAGCVEDHWGLPFVGIEGYPDDINKNRAKTFSKSELVRLFKRAGFDGLYFYYPFPDYKLPEVIYSDGFLPDASSLIPIGTVYGSDSSYIYDELRAVKSLAGAEEFAIFANSFLVEAKTI